METDMRIVILGQLWGNTGLFYVTGVGYGWNGSIFGDSSMINFNEVSTGLISDGIDF